VIEAGTRAPAGLVRHRETTAVLGMTIFIASWVMLFAGLFFAYAVTRARALAWPPADLPALPRALPALATLALAGSSLLLERARRARAHARPGLLALAWLAAAAFLFLQLVVWASAWRAGLRPQTGSYASVFFGLTGFHGVHVAVGLLGLAVLLVRVLRAEGSHRGAEAQSPDQSSASLRLDVIPLRLWTLYFHMVAFLWAVMYVGVYLL
jgi:cytochrome c oxidase subunit III